MRIKNWERLQHYRNRRPPWLKLYRDLLDDLAWHSLNGEAAKALVMLWLIASEYDGELPGPAVLAFRLRISESRVLNILEALSPWIEHVASDLPADCKHVATSEREGEGEGETTLSGSLPESTAGKAKANGSKYRQEAIELLEFLNQKTGRAFRAVDANLELIIARLKEGHSPGDCRAMILRRVRAWGSDDKMREYLRPATLFNKIKFSQYVGEVPP